VTNSKTAPRKPFWRRINRHQLYAVHILFYIVGSILIWSLRSPEADKQFDTLFWLGLVCAHGMVQYARRRVTFVLHLLMYSAGNAAIWATTMAVPNKLALTVGWTIVAGIIGIFLFRRYALANPASIKPAKPKPAEKPKVEAKPKASEKPKNEAKAKASPKPKASPKSAPLEEPVEEPYEESYEEERPDWHYAPPGYFADEDTQEIVPVEKKRGRKKKNDE
jgi:hypothetical protein